MTVNEIVADHASGELCNLHPAGRRVCPGHRSRLASNFLLRYITWHRPLGDPPPPPAPRQLSLPTPDGSASGPLVNFDVRDKVGESTSC